MTRENFWRGSCTNGHECRRQFDGSGVMMWREVHGNIDREVDMEKLEIERRYGNRMARIRMRDGEF